MIGAKSGVNVFKVTCFKLVAIKPVRAKNLLNSSLAWLAVYLVCVSVWKMKAVIVLVAVVSLHCLVAQGLPELVSSCKHNGETYEIGERVPYDSCNICKCGVYGIMCTLIACPDDSGRCYVNGKWYESGTSVPKADGCNTCLCQNGQLTICTEMACIHN
ncbi:von Willebrand factor C and EGF domain-containing protein [Biomphalaria pfeifferi]|uniref:von Willebrand factor C and EGF domain-containing protein n=1 Tax=Biomphalaria pfeifferi TaxID=112525 RepID=A0AAD8FFN8_BIOPF|nr:von Willebrand factor C and EGF domain-containing protein [Biomphalaria pfeifferi]